MSRLEVPIAFLFVDWVGIKYLEGTIIIILGGRYVWRCRFSFRHHCVPIVITEPHYRPANAHFILGIHYTCSGQCFAVHQGAMSTV